MEWQSPFIVYRITSASEIEEVFHCDEIKKARYWLQYIGQIGDVLCRTPIHPKHSKATSRPEYWSHKEKSGQTISKLDGWLKFANARQFKLEDFPENQLSQPAIQDIPQIEQGEMK